MRRVAVNGDDAGMAERPLLFNGFRLMDFYNFATGDIDIPPRVRLRYVAPDDTIGSRLRDDILRRRNNEDTEG
jgi:hypothetical protein